MLPRLGWNEALDTAPIAAVLRSWEDRFGARLLRVGFAQISVLAQRPPRTLESAQRLAAEQWAFCDECAGEGLHDVPCITASLLSSPIWTFWWDLATIDPMSPVSESPSGPDFSVRAVDDDGRAVVNDYDSFAEAYTAQTEANLFNGYYCRPAILDLAGNVAGRRVLDAGCGSGPLSAALRDRGAIVTSFDSSAKMLELARRRLGQDADLRLADLGSALPFADGAFDDVIACLVLHYLQDWTAPLAELRRVLKPGGRLIVAVDHPFAITLDAREAGRKPDYFATYNRTEEWTIGDRTAPMSFWTRPLHAMTDAFTAAGFRIAVISEPPPAPGARELFPEILADIPSAFLCFLFFVLQAD